MIPNKLKSYFLFSREHRSGIFLLIAILVIFQILIFTVNFTNLFQNESADDFTSSQWLAIQHEIDSLKKGTVEKKYEIKPFNPNFITDYKGYVLGISVEELNRLQAFRNQGKFVNSAKEFQQVTQVSDEVLNKISPYFKFPDWVKNKSNSKEGKHSFFENKKAKVIIKKDINLASKEDLMDVYGIGDKISDIILKEKEKFGMFASLEQLQFVWGVSPEAYEDLQKRFFIGENLELKKININSSNTKTLAAFPYFNYAFAKEIVTYRSMHGEIKKIEDLTKINNCPQEKLKLIALYLEFN
jgi:DNA uptake protein ComE-like DNA-binding protein